MAAENEDHDRNGPIRGSCLCGAIRYSARGPLTAVGRCHCVQCRKASGAEFATNASVSTDRFEILQGKSLLGAFESSPGQERLFCRECGSPLFKRNAETPGVVRLRLGSVDTEIKERVEAHIFLSQKLSLSEIETSLPCFERGPGEKPTPDSN